MIYPPFVPISPWQDPPNCSDFHGANAEPSVSAVLVRSHTTSLADLQSHGATHDVSGGQVLWRTSRDVFEKRRGFTMEKMDLIMKNMDLIMKHVDFDHEKCLIWWVDHEEIGNLTMKTGEVMNRLDWHMKKCSHLSHKNSKRTRTNITIYNHLSEMIEEQWPFTFLVSCQSELTQQISKKTKWDILFGYSIYW